MGFEDTEFAKVFRVLAKFDVRYLVVGGLAVVLHGYPRMTADIDLVVGLDSENVTKAVTALQTLGFRPRAPVSAFQFAEPKQRQQWVEEKGLTVFSLWSAEMPLTEIDIFVEEPWDFETEWSDAFLVSIDDLTIPVVGLDTLIQMKTQVGRPKDVEDVEVLERILAGRKQT